MNNTHNATHAHSPVEYSYSDFELSCCNSCGTPYFEERMRIRKVPAIHPLNDTGVDQIIKEPVLVCSLCGLEYGEESTEYEQDEASEDDIQLERMMHEGLTQLLGSLSPDATPEEINAKLKELNLPTLEEAQQFAEELGLDISPDELMPQKDQVNQQSS